MTQTCDNDIDNGFRSGALVYRGATYTEKTLKDDKLIATMVILDRSTVLLGTQLMIAPFRFRFRCRYNFPHPRHSCPWGT